MLKTDDDDGPKVNPIDEHYEKLHCDFAPVPHGSETFKIIEKYLKDTHGSTHKNISLEIEDIFEIKR